VLSALSDLSSLSLLLLALVGLLSIALVALSVWAYRLQQQANTSKPEIDKKNIVVNFLSEQFTKTKKLQDAKFFHYQALNKRACTLRSAYLKIEEKCLDSQPNSKEYHIAINRRLTQLLHILDEDHQHQHPHEQQQELADTLHSGVDRLAVAGHSKAEISHSIEALLREIKSGHIDEATRKRKSAKIMAMIQSYDNLEERVAMKKALLMSDYHRDSLTPSAQLASIASYNSEKAGELSEHWQDHAQDEDLRSQLESFKSENNKLHMQLHLLRKAAQQNTSLNYPNPDADFNHSNLDDLSEQIIEFNEREIKKLKTTVRNQKMAILELEENLAKQHTPDNASVQASLDTLAQLSQSLLEAETCIEMLESELQILREQLHKAPLQPPASDDSATLKACIDAVRQELQDTVKQASTQKTELDFIHEAILADSLEDLSLLIFQHYSDQGCDPFLLVQYKTRHLEMAASGSLSVKDKTVINAMMPNEVSLDKDLNQLYFRHQYIGGILRFLPDQTLSHARQESLVKMAKIADKFIEKLMANQVNRQFKKQLESCSNNAKQVAQAVDFGYEQHIQSCKQLVIEHFGRIQTLLRGKNASGAQISGLKQAEQDILDELTGNSSFRIKVRKEFLGLVKRIEDSPH
jgi:hypothetical protein